MKLTGEFYFWEWCCIRKSGVCVLPQNSGTNFITLYVNFKTCYDVIHKTLPFVTLLI